MAARLRIHVKPRSNSDAIVGVREGLLSVSVTAIPDGGKANAAVQRLLAAAFGVPKSTVQVVRGHTAREKTVEFATLDDAAVATIISRYTQG